VRIPINTGIICVRMEEVSSKLNTLIKKRPERVMSRVGSHVSTFSHSHKFVVLHVIND
jgi:hypothetical protein